MKIFQISRFEHIHCKFDVSLGRDFKNAVYRNKRTIRGVLAEFAKSYVLENSIENGVSWQPEQSKKAVVQ